MVVFFLGDYPFTAKDLGDIMDMDIRVAFQAIIDRGLVPDLKPGTPWYRHFRMGKVEKSTISDPGNELVETLKKDRAAAAQELIETYTPEARERVAEAHRRLQMAERLVSD